jgi:glutamine---fructose-6-phosphate transaminase (isomerizing)
MQKQPGSYTLAEIRSQPEAWSAALQVLAGAAKESAALFHSAAPDEIIFTGCGSTYYLAEAAAGLVTELSGLPARGMPASELWLYQRSAYPAGKKTLLVAVSRSGETTETIRACESFLKNKRGTLLTLSCYEGRELAGMGHLNLVFPSGMEESVAQTRAFSTLFVACSVLAAQWAGRDDLSPEFARLPEVGKHVVNDYAKLAHQLATDPALDRFYFLASGPRRGLASELSLKMKEMSLSHSEPFHFMEFRHGPKSMVSKNALVIGLLSETNRAAEIAVLNEMEAMGAQILSMADQGARVEFLAGLPEAVQSVLYLPAGQMLAFERSISKGLDPDRPTNLSTVVRLP